MTLGVELHKIRLLGLRPEHEALILGGNLLRLIRMAKVGPEARLAGRSGQKDQELALLRDRRRPELYSNEERLPPSAQLEYQI